MADTISAAGAAAQNGPRFMPADTPPTAGGGAHVGGSQHGGDASAAPFLFAALADGFPGLMALPIDMDRATLGWNVTIPGGTHAALVNFAGADAPLVVLDN